MFINTLWIHTSNHRLNYGKDICGRVSCYVACSCQSRLAINYVLYNATGLVFNTLHPSLWWLLPLLAWLLRCSLCFLFPYLELSLMKWVRPQILLCVLTKNQGPRGRVLFYPPYPVIQPHLAFSEIVMYSIFYFSSKPEGLVHSTQLLNLKLLKAMHFFTNYAMPCHHPISFFSALWFIDKGKGKK